ncbi:MAG: 2-oxoacid:ferredoxin oxidoreductase subunit beta [Calditrichaeota bacterium]|nr:MAG: 2-oxoacid:ferredoxin oxidoreductase subunit beta [Calditrichota bacterium]
MEKKAQTLNAKKLTKQDFASDQEPRWCVGCGDYAILAQVKRVLPELGIPREKIVFVSGIGCSSRFPYYLNTYGLHTVHGRAPTVATGIKLANPDLSVWIVTGDGDGLSIGGNHLLHLFRRNLDVNVILFNNEIYGLTKGQFSPTSPLGKVTKSSPYGSVDAPLNPISFALGAGATFVARSIDRDTRHLAHILKRAAEHKGCSFIEVYQNCNIFNDGAFAELTSPETKLDHVLYLEHGQPLIFGKEKKRGLRLKGMNFEIVELHEEEDVGQLYLHNENDFNPAAAFLLAHLTDREDYPTPVGVFRRIQEPTYEYLVHDQIQRVTDQKGKGDLAQIYMSGDVWKVE